MIKHFSWLKLSVLFFMVAPYPVVATELVLPFCDKGNEQTQAEQRQAVVSSMRTYYKNRELDGLKQFYSVSLHQPLQDFIDSVLLKMDATHYQRDFVAVDYIFLEEIYLPNNRWRLHYRVKGVRAHSYNYTIELICERGRYRIEKESMGSAI